MLPSLLRFLQVTAWYFCALHAQPAPFKVQGTELYLLADPINALQKPYHIITHTTHTLSLAKDQATFAYNAMVL